MNQAAAVAPLLGGRLREKWGREKGNDDAENDFYSWAPVAAHVGLQPHVGVVSCLAERS
jgi:hypothetical protein